MGAVIEAPSHCLDWRPPRDCAPPGVHCASRPARVVRAMGSSRAALLLCVLLATLSALGSAAAAPRALLAARAAGPQRSSPLIDKLLAKAAARRNAAQADGAPLLGGGGILNASTRLPFNFSTLQMPKAPLMDRLSLPQLLNATGAGNLFQSLNVTALSGDFQQQVIANMLSSVTSSVAGTPLEPLVAMLAPIMTPEFFSTFAAIMFKSASRRALSASQTD